MKGLERNTLVAYLETRYEVWADSPFVLQIGNRSRELARLYRAVNCWCAAYISASNPRGQLAGADWNAAATRRLHRLLDRRGHAWLPGRGVDPRGEWPGESSVLVPGMRLLDAAAVGRRFAQNAVLWIPADAHVRLILLR